MHRLTRALDGPRLWVKRDDATGLAMGGNKARKLEYLMADAIDQTADVVVTTGATQSNHCRQTAAAAAVCAMDCELLIENRFPDWPSAYQASGNRRLDDLLGATVHEHEAGTDMVAAMEARAAALREEGRVPYLIPLGGSSVMGAMGYRTAAVELLRQADDLGFVPDAVVHATASGGTQAGLVAGFAIKRTPAIILGISAGAPGDYLAPLVRTLAAGVIDRIGIVREIDPDAVIVDSGFVGEAYGVPTDEMWEAVELAARLEGLLLDPVYSGKAMAGLLEHVRSGRWRRDQDVVFVHTGGTPALFAY